MGSKRCGWRKVLLPLNQRPELQAVLALCRNNKTPEEQAALELEKDSKNEIVLSRLNENVLKNIAQKTGGKYYAALDTDNFIDPATGQRDPACLRIADFRLDQNNTLHMFVYFRSWDLIGGFPANLAGLQLVKEYVAQAIGAEDGRIIASSKGLHIYSYAIQVAAKRLGMTDVATMDDFVNYAAEKVTNKE